MLKAILIDDEPLARMMVKEYLQTYSQISVVQECNDGFEGLKAIQQHQPDIVFLDIQMPKINGFEMLELIEQPPAIIFTTAFDEYAIKAFENHAVDYLLKPFSKQRFDKALEKYLQQADKTVVKQNTASLLQTISPSPQQQNRVVIKDGANIKIVGANDILYMEAADDYVKIVTKDASYLKNKTLTSFEQQLNAQQFVRVHRSYILNVLELSRLDAYDKENYMAVLRNGANIPISKSGYARLKDVLGM